MFTKVRKWGNSLALRIPKAFALDVQLEKDSVVEILLIDGRIVLNPVTNQNWTLEQLLAGVTNDNIHSEIDTGEASGNEIW